MAVRIPEIEARKILEDYNGGNNQLLEWKCRLTSGKGMKLARTQALYVITHHKTVPKVARKYVMLVKAFGEKIMEEKKLVKPVEKVWCEKLLCQSEKAYHFWGKMFDSQENHAFWLPKGAVLTPEKTLKRVIDYSVYSHRPLKPWQPRAVEFLLANDRCILADDMGLGKTTSAIIAGIETDVKKILVVCPASAKINWKREILNYSSPNDKILIVEGRKWGSTFKYYIINYDIIKNFHTTEESEGYNDYQLIKNEKFDLAIVDEAHYLANVSAKRTQLLNDALEDIPRVWLLTGTPMTSRPINYFNLLKIINSPVALNWVHFVRRYCKGFQFTLRNPDGSPGRRIWSTSGATNLGELRERTQGLMLRRLKTEIPGLPEKIVIPHYLELKSTFYDEEIEEFMRISDEEKENEKISTTLGRLMKVRQVIAYEKVPFTCEIIDKFVAQGKKVLVFNNFTMPIDMIQEKYPKISVKLDGKMSNTKKQYAIDQFQNNPKIKIFNAQIIAGGMIHTLTAGTVVIMNDLSFVPSHHSQAEDRAYRTGQDKNVLVYYPIFENTIEQIMYNILKSKKEVIDEVMGDGEYSDSFTKEVLKEIL